MEAKARQRQREYLDQISGGTSKENLIYLDRKVALTIIAIRTASGTRRLKY